ncbi:hypothetical protein HDV00_007540 [Rhizophlyctis rosea]|nr:hypothetical protein HDV00_007540 [Rhizophlyctis rosea]
MSQKRKADPSTVGRGTEADLDTIEGLPPTAPQQSSNPSTRTSKKQKVSTNPQKTASASDKSDKVSCDAEFILSQKATMWTEREKQVATALIAEHGTQFVKVAEELNRICGKTPKQINAWWYGELRKKKKAGGGV